MDSLMIKLAIVMIIGLGFGEAAKPMEKINPVDKGALHTAVCREDIIGKMIPVDLCKKIITDNPTFAKEERPVPLAKALLKAYQDKATALAGKLADMPDPAAKCAPVLESVASHLDGTMLGLMNKPDEIEETQKEFKGCEKNLTNVDEKTKAELKDLSDGMAVCYGAAHYAYRRYGDVNSDDYPSDYENPKVANWVVL
ncbi:hypothetical protein LINGRAHAP2_LOCUS26111 [Linum grandiflorum]